MAAAALLWLCVLHATAQRQVVVIDAETDVPARDVQIYVDSLRGRRIVTDWQGTFAMPDSAERIILCHSRYERLETEVANVADTIFLLPNVRRLNELVVRGKAPRVNPQIFAGMKEAAQEGAAEAPKGVVSFDFFELFNARKRRRTEKRIKAIENYTPATPSDSILIQKKGK